MYYNIDCIEGCQKHIKDNSVDLIITDPPYGINGDKLHKHYNRNESFVLDGYIEIPQKEYAEFSLNWVKEAERILKPGGSMYIVSGYSNLIDILNSLKETSLEEINHIIWKYNFGIYTKTKFVSSHYHILFYVKPGKKHTFNTYCRYGQDEKSEKNGSSNYLDREDVWIINREYKPNQIKNKNELPSELLIKMIQYSSNENDLVCDLFLGSFSTAKVAIGLNRNATGFEKSKIAFDYQIKQIKNIKKGYLLSSVRKPSTNTLINQGKPWLEEDVQNLLIRYNQIIRHSNKKDTIEKLSKEFQRGYFSILNKLNSVKENTSINISLF